MFNLFKRNIQESEHGLPPTDCNIPMPKVNPCKADQEKTECSLVEQLRNKQSELLELRRENLGNGLIYCDIDSYSGIYGIAVKKQNYRESDCDYDYFKEKLLKAIKATERTNQLISEIKSLKQQLGID